MARYWTVTLPLDEDDFTYPRWSPLIKSIQEDIYPMTTKFWSTTVNELKNILPTFSTFLLNFVPPETSVDCMRNFATPRLDVEVTLPAAMGIRLSYSPMNPIF